MQITPLNSSLEFSKGTESFKVLTRLISPETLYLPWSTSTVAILAEKCLGDDGDGDMMMTGTGSSLEAPTLFEPSRATS